MGIVGHGSAVSVVEFHETGPLQALGHQHGGALLRAPPPDVDKPGGPALEGDAVGIRLDAGGGVFSGEGEGEHSDGRGGAVAWREE